MVYLNNLINNIVNPVIYFLFAVALLYFLFGVLVFVINADDDTARATGKRHMFWGIVGLFIMVSVYGIIYIILGTVGAEAPVNLR